MLPDRPDGPLLALVDNERVSLRRAGPASLAAGLVALALAATAEPPAEDVSPPPADSPGSARPGTPPAPEKGAPPTGLRVVEGVVEKADLEAHRVTVEVAGGSLLTLSFDRNTLVYLPTRLSTVFELRPGVRVRAGSSEDLVAYWIELLPVGQRGSPSKTPGEEKKPGEGTSSPAEPKGPAPAPPP